MVRTKVGCSIKELLCDNLMLNPDYISKNISTIFLNRKPVDDIESAVVENGSTIALSEAMPGLVGAIMRRGSFYASFRSSIVENKKSSNNCRSRRGMVRIKLFNQVIKRLGPGFLKRGIFIKYPYLVSFLAEQSSDFWKGCREILLNGRIQNLLDLRKQQFKFKEELIFLKVKNIRE